MKHIKNIYDDFNIGITDDFKIDITDDFKIDISDDSHIAISSDGSNYIYTTVGTSDISYSPWTTNTYANVSNGELHVKGDANFEGDITIKGKRISDSLERIEERLAILYPNEELEEKWENLRGLRKAYMELEAEIIEKQKIWGILKR